MKKFKPVPSAFDVIAVEEGILKFWKDERIFKKAANLNRGGDEFVFYEGPPTANGKPGVHHVLARVFKDVILRYKTMQGFNVVRRGGWDTHGLPVEIEVERQLGFSSKREIEEYGIERFNEHCRRSVFAYIQEWERLTDRIAFWVDMDDAYVTYSNDYIESVWWIIKNFWERDLIYRGFKVVPYCPRCGTPLSDHEVAMGYAQTVDPSVVVRFPLVDESGTSMLVWTTTPWTLPGNVALALNPKEEYVRVKQTSEDGSSEQFILCKALLDTWLPGDDIEVISTFKGKKLKGVRYQPLYTFQPSDKPAHYIVLDDIVSIEEGTGIVHIAPAFGQDDMRIADLHDLPIIMTVQADGTFSPEVRPWSGRFVKDTDPLIIQDLSARGLLFYSGEYRHVYPFCWRCDSPLLYYARSTWYLRTTQFVDQLVSLNDGISWYPQHFKEGRFGNWLANNVDWALGRERYWGTPLPLWECQSCQAIHCVGSIEELLELSGQDVDAIELHRPDVDDIEFSCPHCDGTMERVPELLDVWFDSGAMPVCQWHYPFENEETFKKQFPADYICEAVDQTRGWFYSLHAISTLLFQQASFKNVICLGLFLDDTGQKMSKSRGTAIDPWDVLDIHGADAFRWYLFTSAPPGQDRRFSIEYVGQVIRNLLLPFWNVYSFFCTYANLDDWEPLGKVQPQYLSSFSDRPGVDPGTVLLDRWILSRLNLLVKEVTEAFEGYDISGATRPIQDFLNALSRWYLRRSRRRFWKEESDVDKSDAYQVLYQTLVTLSKLIAPSMPFIAEEMYRNLVISVYPESRSSVHLADWPEVNHQLIDEHLNAEMELVMKLASLGHAARNNAGIRVRQPLAEAAFAVGSTHDLNILEKYQHILEEELNVKVVRAIDSMNEVVGYSINPLPKQLGARFQSRYPQVRQQIMTMDPNIIAQELLDDKPVSIEVDGEAIEIVADEVEVRAEAKPGLVVAADGPYLAALPIELSPELIQEGLAREFVRHVQEFRKQSGFEIADRIILFFQASSELEAAILNFKDYIQRETLCQKLVSDQAPEDVEMWESAFADLEFRIGLAKAN